MEEEIKKEMMAHSRQIYSFCYHLTGNRTEAEDLYQDTFLTAWEKRKALERAGEGSQIKSYLLGIAANLWKNHQRKKIRRNRIAPLDGREDALDGAVSGEPGPEGNVLRQEMLQEVRRQVRGLPDKLRVVVVMYYAGEMGTEEIGARLGIPPATVRSRLSKARKKLQKGLEESGYEQVYG